MGRVLFFIGGVWLAARSVAATPLPAPADTTQPARPSRRIVVQYDSRYSILNYNFVTINGLKLGIEWPGHARLGGAIYFLSTGTPSRQPRPDDAALHADTELRFRYLAGYGEYVLLETPRWELSGNLQLGLGSAHLRYENVEGDFDKTPKQFMGVIEPSVAAQLRVFKWIGLGAGAGWRQPVFISGAIQRELNGPVFYLRAKLFLGDFVRVVRGRERLFTQEGLRQNKE